MGGGRWHRAPRCRWADPPLHLVQGGQARLHLPREVDREVPGLGLSLHEHRHMLTHAPLITRLPSQEAEGHVTGKACAVKAAAGCLTLVRSLQLHVFPGVFVLSSPYSSSVARSPPRCLGIIINKTL